jgi:hypothetical protein
MCLSRFLCSVIKNVAHLCGRNRSKMWGPEGWKKVVVCVVSDGRNKVNKRTLQVLSLVSPSFLLLGPFGFTPCPSFLITNSPLTYRWDAIKRALQKIPWEGRMLLPTYSSQFLLISICYHIDNIYSDILPMLLSQTQARYPRDLAQFKSYSA